MSTWMFLASRILRRLWVRAALFAALSVLAALASVMLAPFVPERFASGIGAEAVDELLSIMASSMLPVATFSLSTMISAYSAASTGVTPRAAALLMEDKRAQNALSVFIGAFIYAVVGLIALRTGIYGPAGRVIMFGATVVVLALIVMTLIRWIDELSRLGRVGETIDRIESAAKRAMCSRLDPPHYGGTPYETLPPGGVLIRAGCVGYVQHVDVAALDRLAEEAGCDIHLDALPGTFLLPQTVLCRLSGSLDLKAKIAGCFLIGDSRTFDQDPRFGLTVLSEVASRALSPAVNDPGTAIDVIGTAARLLTFWHDEQATAGKQCATKHERIFVRQLPLSDLFDDIFRPIARDGAGVYEVQNSLQKVLAALADLGGDYEVVALAHAREAMARAAQAMALPADLDRLKANALPAA